MADDYDPLTDVDPWVIPLREPAAPLSADAGAAPPVLGVLGPGAEVPPATGPAAHLYLPAFEDELPSDEGFHPRLRRSA